MSFYTVVVMLVGVMATRLVHFISIFLFGLTLCTQLKWHSFWFYLCSNKILGKVYLVPLILGLYNICMVTVVDL